MMVDGALPMLPPPPPTFRAPTRDSVLITKGKRASTLDEEDLSFMDMEIKRLHRDMANMLARENPLADDNGDPNKGGSSSALSGNSGGEVASVAVGREGAEVISRRTSPAGDSDYDYSDDDADGAIAMLKDDLRSTTEKFFELLPRQQGHEQRGGERRRASAFVPSGFDGSTGGVGVQRQSSSGGIGVGCGGGSSSTGGTGPHRHSWNTLERLEKGVGGMMRRASGSSSCLQSLDHGSSGSSSGGGGGGVAFGVDGENKARTPPGAGGWARGHADEGTSSSPPGGVGGPGSAAHRRRPSREPGKSPLSDLKARSEEVARTLKALKLLMVEEGHNAGDDAHPPRHRRRESNSKLWPRVEEGGGSAPRTGRGEAGVDPAASKRMELLAQAMDTLQHLNAELNSRRPASRRRTTGGRERERRHRRSSSSSCVDSGGRRQSSKRLSVPGVLIRHPRSSSDLLSHRRSEQGQAEPMSCGVPRHRVQVSKGGDNVVYFELVITQARSTWTLERRMDEFVELRRSLVATATDLAAEAAAADRERRRQRRQPRKNGSGDGSSGGDGRSLAEARRQHRREAEARVPQLPAERKSWFNSSGIWSVMFARKREEDLTERQVHLASWLATVLADRELVSPELVHFLGGDSVRAQPVLEDDLLHGRRGLSGRASSALSWSSSSGGSDDFDVDSKSEEEDDEEDDDSDLESLRGSLCAPEEWNVTKSGSASGNDVGGGGDGHRRGRGRRFSPRDRLERSMGKRLAFQLRSGTAAEDRRAGVTDFSGITVGLSSGGGTATEEEEGREVEDGDGDDEEEEEEEEEDDEDALGESAHSPGFKNAFASSMEASSQAFSASMDVPRQPRAPSPSSPARRVTLDAFFQAPV